MSQSPDPYGIQSEQDLDALYRRPAEHVTKATLNFLHQFHLAYLKTNGTYLTASAGST
jgi:hypothetical protein